MSRLDAALATLGLRPDADARAVRRAYAQQLKQIDQATQLQAFQALREAYEFALAAIARREAAAAQAGSAPPAQDHPAPDIATQAPEPPAAPPASSGFLPPDAAGLAGAVFEAFATGAGAGFTDEAQATAALQAALADERLLNLEARTLFELQVAHLIMGGWRPGHEFLFGPACEVFGWEKDRAHLRVFGQLGAGLDAAINEKMIFFRLSPREFDLQRSVIRRLRQTEPPSLKRRRDDLRIVQTLVQRYPNWLRLITSQANINSWFVNLAADPVGHDAVPPTPSEQSPAPRQPARTFGPWIVAVFGFIMVIRMLASLSPSNTQPSEPYLNRPGAASPATPTLPRADRPGVQLAFLGNVTFDRYDGQVIVDAVDEHSRRGRTTLRPGDRLQGCTETDSRIPFIFIAERQGCSISKGVDMETGIVAYTFHVLRNGQRLTAALVMPPAPDASARRAPTAQQLAAMLEHAVATTAQMSNAPRPVPGAPRPANSFQLGHITFALVDGRVLVSKVGPATDRSVGTLEVGDRLMRCMLGDGRMPLTLNLPAETQRCTKSSEADREAGVTPYMFKVWRKGQSVAASLTVRDATPLPP